MAAAEHQTLPPLMKTVEEWQRLLAAPVCYDRREAVDRCRKQDMLQHCSYLDELTQYACEIIRDATAAAGFLPAWLDQQGF